MNEIECRSEWNIEYVGVLTPEMVFGGIIDYQHHTKPLSIFKDDINFHSHEALLFKEKYIPFVYNITNEIDSIIGKRVKITTKNGKGLFFLTEEPFDKAEINYIFHSTNVLCSDIEGMEYLRKNNIKKIAQRGEFINDIALKFSKTKSVLMEETFDYCSKYFEETIFRFSDPNNNSIIGERGASMLLNQKNDILQDELNCVVKSHKKNSNLSVLCPFVRNGDEAFDIFNYIRSIYSGKIGCMIEVPLLIYEGKRIAHLFGFFVIGISDLCQLLQGADRNSFPVHNNTISFIAELLETYFIPHLDNDKTIYITSKLLFDLLKSKNNAHNFLLLSK
jgi:hypothetical protein